MHYNFLSSFLATTYRKIRANFINAREPVTFISVWSGGQAARRYTLAEMEEAVSGDNRIFFSQEEAISAIRTDFDQYPPQIRLFLELGPLILGRNTSVLKDFRSDRLWMTRPGLRSAHRMKKVAPDEFGKLLCSTMESHPPSPQTLAEICTRVFRTPARPGLDTAGRRGIWIDMQMQHFRCRQCGGCCRTLDYHNLLTEADYRLWVRLERRDILEWVGTVRRSGRIIARTIWIEPGSRKYASTCPWLKTDTGTDTWKCSIHDVKPEFCRQYPGSRKHALMTGCSAFER